MILVRRDSALGSHSFLRRRRRQQRRAQSEAGMEFKLDSLSWEPAYKVTTGAIMPRPIEWNSRVDEAGRSNLAPFSYFNAASSEPPHVLFCPTVWSTDEAHKDTLGNAKSTG